MLVRMWRWLFDMERIERPFSMSMVGLSHFFGRLDPLVMAGVDFAIVNEGIMVSAFIPESQLTNMLVRSEFE